MRLTGIARAVATTAVALATTVGVAAPGVAAAGEHGRNPLAGVWRTDGYGTVLVISGRQLTLYDVTGHSCVPAGTAAQAGEPAPGGATRYLQGLAGAVITPHGRRRAVEHGDGAAGTRSLERIAALPDACTRPAPNDPLAVFDRFWEDFEENYPFFATKGVDWHAARDTYRPRIGPATTVDELQDVLIAMLTPLHDAHTGIARIVDGEPKGVYSGHRPGTLPRTEALVSAARRNADAQLTGPERTFADDRLGVGQLPGGIGYLRVSSFKSYADGDFQTWTAELDRALDALLADPDQLNGLVIDVRTNGGGSDVLGLQIASRLADRPYVAYRKVARDDPADASRFTRPEPIVVRPADANRFTGPVAVLTSSLSASAAETFTQALMGRSPHVTRIGENTQGVFSDVMIRTISPDLMIGLPNEEFLAPDGSTFDGPGIPPDVRTPVFTDDELAGLRDSALSTARRVLAEAAQGEDHRGEHSEEHGEEHAEAHREDRP
ncbi:S41 family peptidase [Kitasatospora sp. NPDC097643]|uniref:S41 family peptidase n=1 Tax=Kitasatospora sp. NPDC097643 TaxID=3157230 RepID=UPI0033292CE5